MIQTHAALVPVLDAIGGARRVAVDTEFHSERHYYPRLMLVQIRADDGPPWLIDPLSGLDLRPLGAALSEAPLLLFHGGSMDLQILHRDAGLVPRAVFDTQIAAGFAGGGYPVRLQELVRRYLAEHLPKTETLSDWSVRPLSLDQLRYAADDVLLLGRLADAIAAELDRRGHASFAAACTVEHVARALGADDPWELWRQVPGVHVLDPQERAILRELAAWRERAARERDTTRSSVLSDAMLLDLSRRSPLTPDALRANRRMPSQVWKRDGAAVLACVQRGLSAPPIPGRTEADKLWLEVALAAGRVAEHGSGIARDLLLTDGTLVRLAAGEPIEAWRTSALGSEFRAFLCGQKGIGLPGVWRA
jgi:ribonuclease D